MWIVRTALKLPYTFAVMSLVILILGIISILSMPTDIFPVFNIPVITVVFSYTGVGPVDMEKRFVTQAERAYTTSVSDIEHIESQSLTGVGVIKIFLQPGADVSQAIAQTTATSQAITRAMPPGTTPPLVIRYDASDVPILQAVVSSPTRSEQSLYDYATNFIRVQLATVQGSQVVPPYGGKSAAINVDLNMPALIARGLTPLDVSNAINAQNLVLPSGDAKIGMRDYSVVMNSSPAVVSALNNLPIKTVNGAVVKIGDIAQVRSGYSPQTNIVNRDGRRAILLTILKSGGASTLDVVRRVRAAMPRIESTLPKDVHVDLVADQSIFVRASVDDVVIEALIAACLTAAMILLFLGSLRSTAIVAVSIPLSILTSISILSAIGQTLNIMTLGGLALAVGILVDDTTVTIENVNRHLGMGKPLRRSILDGSREIVMPALVSTLSICIVFIPVAFLSATARSLFLPLALAVIFAMLASYILSRTVTPTFAALLLRDELELHREDEMAIEDDPHSPDFERVHAAHVQMQHGPGDEPLEAPQAIDEGTVAEGDGHDGQFERHALRKRTFESDSKRQHEAAEKIRRGVIWRIHARFNQFFGRRRGRYTENLRWVLEHRAAVLIVFALFCAISFCIYPFVGRDFFPQVDAGQFRLHVRMPPGTRIEETARGFALVEAEIRRIIPGNQIGLILDNIGEPISVNLAFSDSATVSPSDGEILVSLNPGHRPTADYMRELRLDLPKKFPQDTFFFQPGDIVSQILNFGLPAPIDIQVAGPNTNQSKDLQIAEGIRDKVARIPGAVDVHLQQIVDYPALQLNVNRTQAMQIGLTQSSAASNVLISLASSNQAAPNFWLNPQNGVTYNVNVQTPQYDMDSIDSIMNTPLGFTSSGSPELLGNVATATHATIPAVIDHYDIQPVYDVYANNQDRDLGSVSDDIYRVLAPIEKHLPRGSTVTVRGQVLSMNQSFLGLGLGILGALVLVYLLLVVNFQSWIDPLVVVSGAPGTISGILWMLFATQTTLSVPSLMGTIMSIGVATANSVLLVSFANARRLEGMSAKDAVVAAGFTRLRPILMTALAMIIGMIPMALGLGEGGEQNAPLGRAVIGGLLVATFTTLFIVPTVYTLLRSKDPEIVDNSDIDEDELNERRRLEAARAGNQSRQTELTPAPQAASGPQS